MLVSGFVIEKITEYSNYEIIFQVKPNGSLVEAESVGGAACPVTCPVALAAKLSRQASQHGAVFAVRVQFGK